MFTTIVYKDAIYKVSIVIVLLFVLKNYVNTMILECSGQKHQMINEPIPIILENVPILNIEIIKLCIGDFEQQISLIDAYNKLNE